MPDTLMDVVSILRRPRTDMQIARLLGSACIFLYLIIFTVLFLIASSNGASPEKMIGLELPDYADTIEYKHLAESMINDHRFAVSPSYPLEAGRVPGYPAFFVFVMLVFGTLLIVPFFQIAFTACTVALIYLIGVRYFRRSIALAAALIYMIDPIVIYAAWIPISESFFMLLFIGSVYAIGATHRRWWLPVLVAGVLFGLSIYVRPVGYYLAPIIAAMAFAHSESWKIALRNAMIFLFTAFLIMSPWMMRNYIQAGHFAFASSRAWQFYAFHTVLLEQIRTGVNYQEIQRVRSEREFGTSDEIILRQFQYVERLDEISMERIVERPFQFVAFYLFKSAQLFVTSSIVNVQYHMYQFGILDGDPPRGEGAWGLITQKRWHEAFVQTFTHIPRLLERLGWVIVYLSALYAALVSLYTWTKRRDKQALWVLCAFALINAYALMIGPISDDTRYRMVAEPFLLLLAGLGISMLLPHIRRLIRFERTM